MKDIHNGLCNISQIVNNILFNSYFVAATLLGITLVIISPRTPAAQIEANLIQTIDASNFPAPDTAGIVYIPSQDVFLVSDSEINEMAIFQGVNVFKVDRQGSLIDTFSTLSFSDEPTGVTINPANNHCFFSDDTHPSSIYEIDPGEDGVCLTSDDSVTSFVTKNNFGSSDPEDVTYGLNSLFIVDGNTDTVHRIMPGPNGVFDNVLTGDDLVSSFDTLSLGLPDPEGIVFSSTNNTLFIVGSQEDLIIQTTIDGVLLNTIDLSFFNPNRPSGLTLAPSSENPSITNLYMVARGVDNNDDPNENDGKIYELAIPGLIAPTIELISPVDGDILSGTISLQVETMDDSEIASVQYQWDSQDIGSPVTVAPFDLIWNTAEIDDGFYTLTAVATDLYGNTSVSNFAVVQIANKVIIEPPTTPPPLPTGDTLNVPENYATIQAAVDDAKAGDMVLIAPGTYSGGITISSQGITLASRFIESGNASDVRSTIIQGGSPVILVDGSAGNTRIVGLTVMNAARGVQCYVFCEVLNNFFDNIDTDAVSFEGTGGNIIANEFINSGDDAIDLDGPGETLISENTIKTSVDDGIEIRNFNYTGSIINVVVRNNSIDDAGEDGVQLIDYPANSDRIFTFENNLITNSDDAGIGLMADGDTVEDLSAASMPERIYVFNNTIVGNKVGLSGGDNLIAINNIFADSSLYAMKGVNGDSIAAFNLYYNTNGDIFNSNINQETMLNADPMFDSNFKLQDGSPAIDAGVSSYSHLSEVVLEIPSNEYAGQNPDLGRFEYGLDNDNTPPVLTLIGANPMSLSLGDTFTDPGATAMDDLDGDISTSIVTTSDVNTSVVGNYVVTYKVTDSDGSQASLTRDVIVLDNEATPSTTESSNGGSTDRILLLLLALAFLFKYQKRGNG